MKSDKKYLGRFEKGRNVRVPILWFEIFFESVSLRFCTLESVDEFRKLET